MDFQEEDEFEKTQLLFRLDVPFIISSIPYEKSQKVDEKSIDFQKTFMTFQKTHSLSIFENPSLLYESGTIQTISSILGVQGYQDLEIIGKGGFGLVFRAKNIARNEIVALKLQISDLNESSSQEEANLGKFLSKKVAENLKSKTLSIYSKFIIKDPNNNYVLTIIEMELAKYSLRDEIKLKRAQGTSFTKKELKKIAFDLLENLFYIHMNNIAHFDIKPENVLFIKMNESYILADFGISEEIILNNSQEIITTMKGTGFYMSPKMKKAYSNNQKICSHNPFKSDLYSLGLILLELTTVSAVNEEQFHSFLRTREGIQQLCEQYPLYLTNHFLFYEEEFYKYPNILSLMLEECEDLRKDVMEICLIIDFQEPLLTQILTPLSNRFLPNISSPSQEFQSILGYSNTKDFNHECIQIFYTSRPVVYIGQFKKEIIKNGPEIKEIIKKDGKGILLKVEGNISEVSKENYKDFLIYEGFWKENLPHSFGILNFGEKETKYEGNFCSGRFNGKGDLFIRGIKIKNNLWFDNLAEEYKESLCVNFINTLSSGYYKFRSMENKIFLKVKSKEVNGNLMIFDLFELGNNNMNFLKGLLELMNNRFKFKKATFKEKIENPLIAKGKTIDQFSFSGTDFLFSGGKYKLKIILKPFYYFSKQAKQFEKQKNFAFLKCEIMSYINHINFANSSLQDKDFLEIFSQKSTQNLKTIILSHNENITDPLFVNPFPFISSLVSLDLSFTKLSDETIRYLSSKAGVKLLEELNLSVCRNITNDAIKSIMSSPNFKFLKKLLLDSCLIGDESFDYFAKSPYVKNLTELNICHCSKLTDLSIKNIAISENSKNLIKLDLSYLHITDISLQLVYSSKFLTKIEWIDLTRCGKISHEAITKLLNGNLIKTLKVLKIGKTKIISKITQKLKDMNNLEKFKVKKCHKITDELFESMDSAKTPSKITCFSLGYTKIGSKTLEFLRSPFFNKLEILKIPGCCNISDSALIDFFSHGRIENLKYLDISETLLTDEFLLFLGNYQKNNLKLETLLLNNSKLFTMKGIHAIFSGNSLVNCLSDLYICNFERFAFFDAMKNSVLSYLDLKGTKIIDLESLRKFIENFSNSSKSTKLKLDLRNIDIPKETFCFSKKSFCFSYLKILTGSLVKSTYLTSYIKAESQKSILTPSKTEDITDEILKSFSNSLCLKNLKELNFSNCNLITDNGFSLIMNSPNCRNLEKIDLSYTNLGDLSLISIEISPSSNNLQSLILFNNENITFQGILKLIESKKMASLSKFDVRIKKKPQNFKNIEEIFCSFANSTNIFTHLFFDFSCIKCEEMKGLYYIYQSFKKMKNIVEFHLSFANCIINEEIILELVKSLSEGMANLETLNLDFYGSALKIKGCEQICKYFNAMDKLKKVEMNIRK